MTAKPKKEFGTLLDALRSSFERSLRTAEVMVEPVAMLWTDPAGEWRGLIAKFRLSMPQLYTLGCYDPAERTGPAIWLKCVVDRSIPEIAPPREITPVLYLPNVARQDLRAAGGCSMLVQPLVELQYRGRVWHQQNGRDWTVEAFLVSDEGLGLDVAKDTKTKEAMLRSLPLLAETIVESLRGRRLEAEDFDKLAVSDPVRDLLRWMSNPEGVREGMDGGRWQAFHSLCQSDFGLNVEILRPLDAASRLVAGSGRWDDVWQRFCEAPQLYPGIADLLREPGAGQGKLTFDLSRNPIANEESEAALRRELLSLTGLPHQEACDRVLALEQEHAPRRQWPWAKLGESPLALGLEPLARLAKTARLPLAGGSVKEMVEAFASEGWRCDAAALDALANTKPAAEAAAISSAVRALYAPWLESGAQRFQALVSQNSVDLRDLVRGVSSEKETCLLFVDGLRFDVGGRLQEELENRDLKVRMTFRATPLPTVTATAKPTATPAFKMIKGGESPSEFVPVVAATSQPCTYQRLREQIARQGVEVIDAENAGTPTGAQGGGWTEAGKLDELGHKLGCGLASQIPAEIDRIAERVKTLFRAGWEKVRIVTDHGWLLLPGGFPKIDLPDYLVETKWARCALVRGDARPAVPTYSWYWNPYIQIVSPPGITCFKNVEYAHGGVSLQECIVPELMVERAVPAIVTNITTVQWRGMRCRVSVNSNDPRVRVDLRVNWRRPDTTIAASVKEIGDAGEVSLVVEDDSHEGTSAMVVVLDPSGNVLDRMPTTVGESQ